MVSHYHLTLQMGENAQLMYLGHRDLGTLGDFMEGQLSVVGWACESHLRVEIFHH